MKKAIATLFIVAVLAFLIERLIQTLLRECVYRFAYDSSDQRREAIGRYVHFYNHHRGHSSLNDNAPISRLTGNNVLRRNT